MKCQTDRLASIHFNTSRCLTDRLSARPTIPLREIESDWLSVRFCSDARHGCGECYEMCSIQNQRSGLFCCFLCIGSRYPPTLQACWTALFRIKLTDKSELHDCQCMHWLQNGPIVDIDFRTKSQWADEHQICQFYTGSLQYRAFLYWGEEGEGSEPLCTYIYCDLWFLKVDDLWFLIANSQWPIANSQ